ncbi:AAA family ATPase [Streptosporangium sp. NPDC051022]|uniref:ATP-binding protein n=1 Tax=Streptosporangium sp. NPDC051022 TaxID=3155752 RepID=UPI00343A46D6
MEGKPWWRGNLPAETSGFVGRESEVRQLLKLLGETPLVTVTGAGGVGKSRIAVRAAEECHDSCPDGTWLVELSGERDGDLLAHIVAAVLGLCEQSARPQTEALVEFLTGRNLLLLLDACDHLTTACRDLVTGILAGAPGVRIIVTSRQALGLPQEALLPVEPFEVPAAGPVPVANDALRLFLDRAGAVRRGLGAAGTGESAAEGTAEGAGKGAAQGAGKGAGKGALPEAAAPAAAVRICRRLDGIPLAIELAAGWLGDLPVELLADRLDRRFEDLAAGLSAGTTAGTTAGTAAGTAPLPRHRILRAALSWSHELCGPRARLLWARLSVFSGNFDTEAARWVCGDEHLADVPGLLVHLADRALLVRVPGGYRQPDAVREYGGERLVRLGERARFVRRHRCYHLDLARRADAAWYGPRQEEWAARLSFSIANLRLALGTGPSSAPPSAELAGALWVLWSCLGRLREGRHHLRRAIEAAPVTDPALPRLLWADGCVALAQGDLEYGRRRVEAALPAALGWDDHAAAGHARLRLAGSRLLTGDLDEAEAEAEVAREHFGRAEGATVGEPLALVTLAMAATWRGEFTRAVSTLEEMRRLCDARGERWARACGDYVLSVAQLSLGRVAEAAVAARRSLDVKWRFRDATGVVLALDQLAVIAAIQGDGYRTARLQGTGVRLWALFGLRGRGSESVSEPRTVAERTARQLLGDDVYDAVFAQGRDDDPGSAVAYALG